jgi:[acyl-carrier-protein] S-malonyltransferase
MKLGLFPGQGVPAPAVLEALPADDPAMAIASDVLGYDLHKKVKGATTSRKAALPTWLAQPAIYVGGYLAYERARAAGERFDLFAGHSMGEYTALAAAGAFTFEQGLRLIHIRGLAMQRAAQLTPGGMVAVLKLDALQAESIADRCGISVANHNAPTQTVLSGRDPGLAEASRLVREEGGRAVLLGVTGPFHTEAMKPATEPLTHSLVYTRVRTPRVPVISNVTALPYRAPGEIRRLLVEQLTSPVRFRQSLEWAWEQGVRDFHDFGPGAVAAGLAEQTFDAIREAVPANA